MMLGTPYSLHRDNCTDFKWKGAVNVVIVHKSI